jgi:hypothetical protein
MTAGEYMAAGHCFEADGWTVTLDDRFSGGQCPVAVHEDMGAVYELEWDPGGRCWTQDWVVSPLDYHWDDFPALIRDLEALYAEGCLRAAGAIHGLPGASSLGALLC